MRNNEMAEKAKELIEECRTKAKANIPTSEADATLLAAATIAAAILGAAKIEYEGS